MDGQSRSFFLVSFQLKQDLVLVDMSFQDITIEQHEAFLASLRSGQYNLLLGAGVSLDSTNAKGYLPSGNLLRDELCELKKLPKNKSLQKVFALLSEHEIKDYVTDRFVNCIPGSSVRQISSFVWKRAFTFNIDDAMEAAYERKEARQNLVSLHYDDDFQEAGPLSVLPLIHLHGFVGSPERGYVFSRDEYVQRMTVISPWLTVLSQFIKSEPFIIIGTSLDEVDLDFYLAHRKPTSGRDDRGPSILVEPSIDEIITNECQRHGLLHYKGTAVEFFKHCNELMPARPTPYELIPSEAQKIVPEGVSKQDALKFLADFELVPGTSEGSDGFSRFLYGHPPTWADLSSDLDIARAISGSLTNDISELLVVDNDESQLILLTDDPGTGKTTVLRRCAFDLAQRGIRVLHCTALSRLEPATTADIIDLVDDPIVIIADNFADQVSAFAEIIERMEKRDIVILGAERSYRIRYIEQVLSGIGCKYISKIKLREIDISHLIDNYIQFGLVGSKKAISHRDQFCKSAKSDPIAVACCRILNDFRPLDRIIEDIYEDCGSRDQDRYLMTSLAQHCFKGGIRYAVLAGAVGGDGLQEQLQSNHRLPLAFFVDQSRSFIVPQNSIIGSRILRRASDQNRGRLLEVFVALATQIAPRVNRGEIKRRSPEARLAGRLFDFDAVTQELLQELATEFYVKTQAAWQWNSRYWEQVALLNLSKFRVSPETEEGLEALNMAVQHARHAVSIEYHPLSLTTLGKTLAQQMMIDGFSLTSTYGEAFETLIEAIRLERSWSRMAVHPFITLFRATRDFLDQSGSLSDKQVEELRSLITEAASKFRRDIEVQEALDALRIDLFPSQRPMSSRVA